MLGQLCEMSFSERMAKHAINEAPGDIEAKVAWSGAAAIKLILRCAHLLLISAAP